VAKKNELGSIFGSLTVISEQGCNSSGQIVWLCKCACGAVTSVDGSSLRLGRVKSCGCQSPRFTSERMLTHGLSKTRTYRIWNGMGMRCSPKANGSARKNYYEKGIRVCQEWESFENFYADMGECPEGYTLGRIDGNKGYELNNCRYETYKQQANNTSKNKKITYKGLTLNIGEWADMLGIKQNTLVYRFKRNWPTEKALAKLIG
jgi:hypothetical protein